MIANEVIFLAQILCVALGCIVMLRLGCAALTSYIACLGLLSNLLVCKEIVLFGLTVTASDSLAVGMLLGLNLMQEWFGKKAARDAIYINFLILLLYLVLTQIHLLYMPGPLDKLDMHYQLLLGFMPRLAIASLTSCLIVQLADNALYRWLAQSLHGRWFTLRNTISLCLSEGLDTILFSVLGLYGLVSSISDIIIFSYVIKLISIGCFIPLIALIKKLVPHDKQNI